MRSRRFSLAMGALVPVWLITLAGCTRTPGQQSTVQHATFTYTCCSRADVTQVRHPGDVIHLHWIVSAGPPSATSNVSPVTLVVALSGPYQSVESLKGASTPAPIASAQPIHTTTGVGGDPVSTLVIPKDAASGLYNLTTSVESAGGGLSGGSIIQVAASSS